jgi:D-arabinitol 2-dehydrogenase
MQPGASIILIGSMSGVVINVPQPQTPYNFSSMSLRFPFGKELI